MKLEQIFHKMKREWEITLLMVVLGLTITLGGIGLWKFMSFFGVDEKPAPKNVRVESKFKEDAFSFLQPRPARIPKNHALMAEAPKSWVEELRRKQYLAERERRRKLIAERERKQREMIAKKKQESKNPAKKNDEDNKKTTAKKEPPPKPPINHFINFRGFYESASGKRMVYLGLEDVQDGFSQPGRAVFLKMGDEFAGYTVIATEDDLVILEDKNERKFEVIRGDRFQYGRTDNPKRLLKDNAEEDDGNAGIAPIPGNKKGPSGGKDKKKVPDIAEIKKLLEMKKGNISRKDVQEYLKKNNLSTKDLEKFKHLLNQ